MVSRDILVVTTGKGRYLWVEARDAAKHSTLQRTALYNKEAGTPNVSSSKTEKQWLKETFNGLLNLTLL